MKTAHATSTPAANPIEDRVLGFLELSQEILSLVRHENAILLEKGELKKNCMPTCSSSSSRAGSLRTAPTASRSART